MTGRTKPRLLALGVVAALALAAGSGGGPGRSVGPDRAGSSHVDADGERNLGEEPGEQGEEGDAEGLAWFFGQRAYPHGIPRGAYALARRQSDARPVVGLGRDGKLSAKAVQSASAPASARGHKSAPGGETSQRTATTSVSLAALSAGGTTWTPLGPLPVSAQATTASGATSDFRQYSGPPPFSGRVTAIATHPTNAQTAYVGGAVGGLWRTVDGGTTFTPLFDGQPSLSVGAVAIDRTSPTTVYVGTGEANAIDPYGVSGPGDSYYGTGLYKSTNSGSSWTRIGTSVFGSCHIGAIQTHPTVAGIVVVAVTSSGQQGPSGCAPGIYRSTDGGSTWSLRLGTAATGGDFAALSLAVSPAAPARWFAGISKAGVYRSLDAGQSWTYLSAAPLPDFSNVGRVAVAVSPVDANRVYAVMADRSSNALGIWTTGNAGTSWAAADASGKPACSSSSGQCNYDLAIAASPVSAGTFTVGAVKLRRYTNFGAASSIVLDPQTGGGSGVHWDTHVLTFDASNRLWVGTDGGAYRWDGTAQPVNLNSGLALTQFYPGISGTTSDLLLGGTQDMATNTTVGLRGWTNQASGDGGYTVIDRTTSPATVLASLYNLTLYRSTNGGSNFAYIGPPSGIPSTEGRQFITPMVAGTGNPLRVYAGLSKVYRSVNRGTSWAAISPVLRPGDTITALAQAPTDANVVWAATKTGHVFRTLNALAVTPSWVSVNLASAPVPYRFITDIAIDPANSQNVWITLSGFNGTGTKASGHLFHSTDAGINWQDASGNLPNTPTNAVVVLANGSARTVFVGTDVGVFASSSGGATWARFQTGLPNLVVSDLILDPAARRLVAATFGRGMFTACSGAAQTGDAFASPRALGSTANGALTFSTTCAGRETGEPSHSPDGDAGGASVWLTWTAPRSGTATFSTSGSGFDTLLAVYRGTAVTALTAEQKNDDATSTDQTSRVSFAAVAGRTYRIAVDGYLYDGYALARNGSAKLSWSLP